MKLLLDTHVFIWWDSEPDKLSPKVLDACQDQTNVLVLSVVSVWEIQIKTQLGKLELKMPIANIIDQQRRTNGIEILDVRLQHVLALQALPRHHKDPFDRLLIAQTNAERATLVSHDAKLSHYEVPLLW